MADPTLSRELRTNAAALTHMAQRRQTPEVRAALRGLVNERDGLIKRALQTRDVVALASCTTKELRAVGTADQRSRMNLGASGAMASIVRLRSGR